MAAPLLAPQSKGLLNDEDVELASPPTSTEETVKQMAPVPPGVVPKMGQKAKASIFIRSAVSPEEDRTSIDPNDNKLFTIKDKSPDVAPDDLTMFKNPMVEKLATTQDFDPGLQPRDVVNFLFKDTMGVAGAKWDTEGFSWEWENAKQQWSEQPMWLNLLATTDLFGTALFPIAKAAHMTTKIGRVGEALGLTGSHADEIVRWQKMDILDKSHIKDLTFNQRKSMRIFERNTEKWPAMRERAAKAERGEPMGIKDKILYSFEKNFANDYFNKTSSTNAKIAYNSRLDQLWKAENIGKFFVDIPDEAAGPKIYQRWLHQMDPTNVPHPTGMSPQDIAWADNLGHAKTDLQKRMFDAGVISQDEFDKIGPMHLSAQYKGTPEPDLSTARQQIIPLIGKKPRQYPGTVIGSDKPRTGLSKFLLGDKAPAASVTGGQDYIAVRLYGMPRLNSETLMKRSSDLPEIYQRLQKGQLITDPHDLTVRSFVVDHLLLNNFEFVRDAATDARYAVSHDDMILKYIDKTGKFDTNAAKKAGYVHLDSVGGNATERLQRMIKKKGGTLGINGELPWIRREIFDEAFGEHSGMFAQSQNAVSILDIMSSVFKSVKTAGSIPSHFNNATGNMVMLSMAGMNPFSPRNVDIAHNVSKAFGKISEVYKTGKAAGINSREIMEKSTFNLGDMIIDGRKFNLNDELLHPAARELFDDNSLDATEGFAHLEGLYEQAKRQGGFTKSLLKNILKAKNIAQVNNKVKWFDQMTKAYVAEDMIPKMSYYMHLRSQGFSKTSASIETGRRLPMYNTVGSAIKGARKFAFPWLTFTTEAARITKNNLMDYPIRTMPWLHMPAIIQSLVAGMEGRGYEDIEAAKRSLPLFAQSPTTVMASGRTQATAGGAATGGLLGMAGGMLRAGAPGAAVGGVLGAMAGAGLTSSLNKDTKELRGAMMDWLPHSAFMVTSTSPDFEWTGRTMLEQIPSQPLAIVKPFWDVLAGQTPWGQQIGGEGIGDSIQKMIAGFIGNLAPPIIQKYGFKVTTPDVSVSEAFLGKSLPGDFTNMSRALIDTGIAIDPASGKPGNLSQDFVLNNFGMWKSYAAKPDTRLSNEGLADQNQEQIRTYLAKNLDYHLANGQDDLSTDILSKVQRSFAKQYVGNPREAQKKFGEWLKRKTKAIGQHPRLRSWSKEELEQRLHTSSSFAEEARGQARDEMIKFLQEETRIRNMGSDEVQTIMRRKEAFLRKKTGLGGKKGLLR